MSLNKFVGLILIAIGILLLVMGYNADQSVGSQVRQAVTGSMTDKTMMFYFGGGIVTAIGVFMAFLSHK